MADFNRQYKNPLFSIIIPCKKVNGDVLKCVWECENLPQNKEIFVVTDNTCPGYPAEKRNWAMERAKGDFLAFLDSDSYPSRDWFTNSLIHFEAGFAGVCGPGIIPAGSSILEHASDWVYRLMPYSYRVVPKRQRIVSEFPTFNLVVKRELAPRFKDYLTGEDSLFCRELKGLILYDPKVVVYHKRRKMFKPFWKQVRTYGLHRGHLIRLALSGWITTVIVYGYNFMKGLFRGKNTLSS